MGEVKVINGNCLDAPAEIIGHQTNVYGVMGAGIAAEVSRRFPAVYEYYRSLCSANANDHTKLFGTVQYVSTTTDDGRNIIIANMFSQNTTPASDGSLTSYENIRKCLIDMRDTGKTIAIPFKIGCGIAGGSWEIVYNIICDVFDGKEDQITIYKYNPVHVWKK